MTFVHIHAPAPIEVWCAVIDCPTCARPRRMLGRYYEWFGASVECAGCGDRWNDGEREERPFAPGWRRKNIEATRHALARIGVRA